MPDRWEITQLDPEVEPFELSNNLAVHFGQITNMAFPLKICELPPSLTGPGLIPQLDCNNVQKMIEGFKKCNSRVDGDIQRELVGPCAKKTGRSINFFL